MDRYRQQLFIISIKNPLIAGRVHRLEDWKWSSLREYPGINSEGICDKEIAYSFLDIKKERLLEDSYLVIGEELIDKVL